MDTKKTNFVQMKNVGEQCELIKGAFYSQAKLLSKNYTELINLINFMIINYGTVKGSKEKKQDPKTLEEREQIEGKIEKLMDVANGEYNELALINTQIFYKFLDLTNQIFLYKKGKSTLKKNIFKTKRFLFEYKTNIIEENKKKRKSKHRGYIFDNKNLRSGENSVSLIFNDPKEEYDLSRKINNMNDAEFTLENIIKKDPILKNGKVSYLTVEQLQDIGLYGLPNLRGPNLSDLTIEQLSKIGIRFSDIRSYVLGKPENKDEYIYFRARIKTVESLVNKIILKIFGEPAPGKIEGKVSSAEGISDTLGATFVVDNDLGAYRIAHKFADFFGQKLPEYNVKNVFFKDDRIRNSCLDGIIEYKHYTGKEKKTGRSADQLRLRYCGCTFDIHCVSKDNEEESNKNHGAEYKKERLMILNKLLNEKPLVREVYDYLYKVYKRSLDNLYSGSEPIILTPTEKID
ncbi:MAG: hypothetical protein KKE93_00145 [Nanoarchaeota archaeon]|nr:hypothetical protein [Nanoarchaeota archaeon]